MVVNNTNGFGLYCSSAFGQIIVQESMFANARATDSESDNSKMCSGNAQFWLRRPGEINTFIVNADPMYNSIAIVNSKEQNLMVRVSI